MFPIKTIAGWWVAVTIMGLLVAVTVAHGQSEASSLVPTQSLWVGADYSNLHAGFPKGSNLRISGIGVFGDYNWNHQWSVEAKARFLDFNSWYGETEQDYLVGPHYTFLHNNKLRPFASFQIGIVRMQYPFKIGTQSLFAMAPGGGVEYRLNHKWAVRGSYEFQFLPNSPNFTDEPKFGIKPNGLSVGISYHLH
jgi:hypothetical protein